MVGASDGLDYRTAKDLVRLLATRLVSAVELFERTVARIEARDKQINAVVVRDFERARDAAKAADAALARGERGSAAGPADDRQGILRRCGPADDLGVPAASDWRPNEDALAVARLKTAGAVILGKTNVPLRLADGQSFNDIYGTTNNPWDLTRTPGGSSGGSAASLAAGFVSLDLGSDRAGSLRNPAHYCGVFAHKPSLGLVPLRGHSGPHAPALPVESDGPVAGPMARSAADLALALEIVAGPDDQTDGIAYRLALPPPGHEDLRSFRILVVEAHPLIPTASTVRIALERLTERLNKAGAKIARTSSLLPDLAEVARIHARLASSSEASFLPADRYAQNAGRCQRTGSGRQQSCSMASARRGHEPSRLGSDQGCARPVGQAMARPVPGMGRRTFTSSADTGLSARPQSGPKREAHRHRWRAPPLPRHAARLARRCLGCGLAGHRRAERPIRQGAADRRPDHRAIPGGPHDHQVRGAHGARVRRLRCAP
jgi:Asp-tRNA(Asn)/Glu-tRNA(Gln) amidotransferase A subunit family amidase